MRERACVPEGTCYPTNHVLAAFESRPDAEEAEAALRSAGFADVYPFHGQEAYRAIAEANRRVPAVTRMWRRLRDVGGDEGELHERYLLRLRHGGSYLIVRADRAEHVLRARDIMAAYRGHDIWHLSAWSLERLPDEPVVTSRA